MQSKETQPRASLGQRAENWQGFPESKFAVNVLKYVILQIIMSATKITVLLLI